MRRLRLLMRSWFLVCVLPLATFAQENPTVPLDSTELREILLRLNQLPVAWEAEQFLRNSLQDLQNIRVKDRDMFERDLNLERERSQLLSRELDSEKVKSAFYEQAYRDSKRKTGFGYRFKCGLKKAFTLGLGACT